MDDGGSADPASPRRFAQIKAELPQMREDAPHDGAPGTITPAVACRIVACWPGFVVAMLETLQAARR